MNEGKRAYKIEILMDFGLDSAAVFYLTIQGIICEWPMHVYLVLWCNLAVLALCTFWKRISLDVQSFVFATITLSSIFVCGIYISNFETVIVLFIGAMVMFSLYRSPKLMIYGGALYLILIVIYSTMLDQISFANKGAVAEFLASMLVILGIVATLSLTNAKEKRTKEKLEESVIAAKAAERSKSEFLANMSHEIRTPMNAIIGMCELALRERDVKESVRECCTNIQNSGRSLLSIINDVLDFSKIESGKMELVEEEFNIASTLNDVINMAMTRMGDKRLELIVNVDPEIPRGILGDEIRIRQIIINLVTNAIKYTPSGTILLSFEQTKREYGINLNVHVEDTGIGITPENLEKLFESFQQVDTKKNRAVEGTGLGLAITKRLLRQMGGFINVQSEYEKGSVFSFVIPLRVVDKTPFIEIKEPGTPNVISYMDEKKMVNDIRKKEYISFISGLGRCLNVKYHYFREFERVKKRVEMGGITHCFTGKEEYLSHQEFFDGISNDIEIIIVQERKDAITPPENMRCIYKPFYAMSIASVLNNESIVSNYNSGKVTTASFVAPKARVLVVDDNAVNLQVAVGLMQPYHMQIVTTETAKDSIRLLASKDFDLVLMDHMMPVMDGMEATKIIRSREDEYYRKLPIVALTANAVGGAREKFLANGFDGFLAKPIELTALDRILKQFVPEQLQEKMAEYNQEVKEEEDMEFTQSEESRNIVNMETGLMYAGKSMKSYLAILKTYVDRGPGKRDKIKQLYDDEEWKDYIIEVHALKSSSLSVGAEELSECAKELELKGKAGDYQTILEKNDELLELYDKVLVVGAEILKEYLKEDETKKEKAEPTIITKEQFETLVSDIQESIDNFDSDTAIEAIDKANGYIYEGKELDERLKEIRDFVDEFEYEQALSLLENLKNDMKMGGDD